MIFNLKNCQSFFNLDSPLYAKKVELLKLYGFTFEKSEHFGWKNAVRCIGNGNDIEINSIEALLNLKRIFDESLIIDNNCITIYDDYIE